MIYYIGRFLGWVIAVVMGRLRVHGRACVPRVGGAILAGNHTSYADPVLMGVAAPRRLRFMAKRELFSNPVFGWLIDQAGAYPVRRGTADREALRKTDTLLREGNLVTVYIEGGTSKDGRLQPPELGAAMLAARAGVPIVPTAIINADKLLPRHGKGVHFTHLQVIFGEPVTVDVPEGGKADREALMAASQTVMRRIADLLRAHGAADRVPEGYLEGV